MNNEERLQLIIKEHKPRGPRGSVANPYVTLPESDFDWLTQTIQLLAEKIENQKTKYLKTYNLYTKLHTDFNFHCMDIGVVQNQLEEANAKITELQQTIDSMRKAGLK